MTIVPELFQDSHYVAVLIFVPNENKFKFKDGDKEIVPRYCYRYDIFKKTSEKKYNHPEHWGYTWHRDNGLRNIRAFLRRRSKKRENTVNTYTEGSKGGESDFVTNCNGTKVTIKYDPILDSGNKPERLEDVIEPVRP